MNASRLAILALALAERPSAAQTGTLAGRVTNARTGAPVTSVHVTVSGTPLRASLDASGRFRLADVPVAAHQAIASGVGYKPDTAVFSLARDGTVSVLLSVTATAIELDAAVVTGSFGDTRRRAVGNAVGAVDASDIVARSAVANLSEVLLAKVPGLVVFPSSGTVGTAASFRLRGAGSLYANNNPTVYVDGVRVSSRDQGNYYVFGQTTTSYDAINPADIESIEVIKGPAASTLYGSEAAAGVMQIFTKRGRSGRVSWQSRVETGRSDWDRALRPLNFAVATSARIADTTKYPGFIGTALGDVLSVRPMSDGRALRTARLSKVFLSASGGGDQYTFFLSAGKSDEEGVFFNNYSNLQSLRGTFAFVPASTLSFATNVAISRSHVRLPLNDDAGPVALIFSSYLAVPGQQYGFPGGRNYLSITPEVANTYDNQVRADRYTIGASADYAPVLWFKNRFRVGLDANVGRAELYFPPDSGFLPRPSLGFDNSKGFIAEGRPLNQDVTLNYDGTLIRHLSGSLVSNSSFGVQYLSSVFRRTDAYGRDLGSVGVRSVGSAAVTTSDDSSSQQKSFGFFVQQQLARDDRLFVTAAVRIDNNSAFGSRLNWVFYPKASLAYVISEEPYFSVPGVSSLRLRAAWGQAGNAPGPLDAVRSYVSSVVTDGAGTSSALRYGSPGNPNLRPERGSELELGFEGAFLDDRFDVDASYYRKKTRDALIKIPVPASTGFTGSQLINVGETSNTGIEMLLRVIPVKRKSVSIDASMALTANRNRLVSGDGRGPIILPSNYAQSQRYQEGFPLGAMWAQRARYNPDGTLLKVSGGLVLDTVYMGPSVPTREIALSGGLQLFGMLRVSALGDYKGGHYQFNVKEWQRDRAGVSWNTVSPGADPDEVFLRQSTQTFLHIQRADFVKLRDVSISYDVPPVWLRGLARRATVTAAGHNLKIWTRYGGADPEVNFSGPDTFTRDDAWTLPQTRRYSAALAVGF